MLSRAERRGWWSREAAELPGLHTWHSRGPVLPWAPHSSSNVEVGPVKLEDTTGAIR